MPVLLSWPGPRLGTAPVRLESLGEPCYGARAERNATVLWRIAHNVVLFSQRYRIPTRVPSTAPNRFQIMISQKIAAISAIITTIPFTVGTFFMRLKYMFAPDGNRCISVGPIAISGHYFIFV